MTDESGHGRPRRRRVLAALAGGLGVSLAGCSGGPSSPTPSPSSTTEPTASPNGSETPTGTDVPVGRLRSLAASTFRLYAVGAFEDARRYYADRFDEDLDTEELRGGWNSWTAEAGRFEGVAGTVHRTQDGFDVVKTVGAFEAGLVAIDFVYRGNADVVGLFHSRPNTGEYSPPSYAASDALTESEVTLSGGPCDLPATLTTPGGSGAVPGVVLVGDDGPRDRNGAVGPNRPLQDLAWGLADRGVASLRYDSRALACESLAPEETTLDALVADATAAVERLRASDRVDSVAVVGHGLGGWVAPRVAAETDVSGVAALASPGRPLTTTRPEAARHVVTVDDAQEDTEQRWVDHVTSEAERAASGDLAADETALGATGAFWASVADYDPVAQTSGLSVPTLLLFGGRDFEVPGADRERWAEAGEVQVVDAANHLLQPGEGPATPGEYALPNTVAESVVDAVAGFVAGL